MPEPDRAAKSEPRTQSSESRERNEEKIKLGKSELPSMA
jgi:hypothetical protein